MKYINVFREWVVVFLFSFLVITVSIGIFSRFLTSTPFAWTEELSRFLFIWLAWVSSSLTIARGANITFDILLQSIGDKLGRVPYILVDIISIFYVGLVIYFGYELCINNLLVFSPLLNIPMWLINLSIPIGGVLMLIEQIHFLIKHKDGKLC
ncbi:TRAP transporter small permease [Gallibacterium genomosp. 1]|uniref:TRAP transporter small permease protein n=1 Tax=Gallibacterium genomosp. 1 TaxID=155515 RepID=A0A0A2XYD7_9PAST|nr:TRAP transporter small permease [Gallibacterium genomosp. 1]KGQ37391.1 C4-dicarboxylate ABC transporter permease [Gallibacterium genomosp. 1]